MSSSVPQTWRSYLALTKPRILPMVILSGIPPFLLEAGSGRSSFSLAAVVLGGITLAAAAASVLNCYIERDLDALMERTRARPLPAARLSPRRALGFGLLLGTAATAVLATAGGPVAAALGVASILFYVFIYTVWLKPRSHWNAVIGGAAGAAGPLIADAAIHGSVGPVGWLLFAIIFFWQPPHVWAIALYRQDDYRRAGVPMLPNVIGRERTRWRMLWYTLALLPVTLAPVAFGIAGSVYLIAALALGAWFTWHVVRVLRERTDAAARRAFVVSLAYLAGLFLAMSVDALVR